jgi:hypothetical protein
MNPVRRFVRIAVVVALLGALPAHAGDSTSASAEASQASLAATGSLVDGSADLLRAGAQLSIAAIENAGGASIVVLRDASTGAQASLRIAADVAAAGSLVVGQAVEVIAEATGCSLVADGRLVAFVPNEVGRALVHHVRSSQH